MPGLLIARDPGSQPGIVFEHKALYRSVAGPVPESYYAIEIGKARHLRAGEELSIITYGSGVLWAMTMPPNIPNYRLISWTCAVYYRSTTMPSVRPCSARVGCWCCTKTRLRAGSAGDRCLDCRTLFSWLDAPVMRCASLDTPIPFSIELEKFFLRGRGWRKRSTGCWLTDPVGVFTNFFNCSISRCCSGWLLREQE